MGSSIASNPIIEELRQLFAKEEHESVVVRCEHLQKRKKFDDAELKTLIAVIQASSLIHLGRSADALQILEDLSPENPNVAEQVNYAKLYASWAVNENVSEAIDRIPELSGPDAKRLEAQLLYRAGKYEQAADRYLSLLQEAKDALQEKKRPAATSRWGLASMTGRTQPQSTPVTAAELEQLTSAVNELATNTMASLVLARKTDAASDVSKGLRARYELEYNSACAHIDNKQFETAEICLEKAEALIRSELDEEDDDIEEAMAPLRVQKTYLQHLAGDLNTAEKSYAAIIAGRKADAGSLAVAANNLTVALGQHAFGKRADIETGAAQGKNGKVLPKEQHDALAEGLKKMRATSGRSVERKLTSNQRRAMARNRAILLVQMGRVDACRNELAKVKSDFPDDPVVPLIEATLVARESNLETADKILEHAGDNTNLLAARIQLAASQDDRQRAAKLLQELFPGKPAAIVTAATLVEDDGDVDTALNILRDLVKAATGPSKGSAKKALAQMLLRNEKYEEAATLLQDVCAADTQDSVALAQLVLATSYLDPQEAARLAERLPQKNGSTGERDIKELESLPPPRRKYAANKSGLNAVKGAQDNSSAVAAAPRERKKRKKKNRLPKNYDPNGPPPDPERWLPKTLRSGYKKKKSKNDSNNFRGAQGADAATVEAAAQKNAQRSAARAAAAVQDGPLPPSGRSKLQRKKKNRR